MAFDCVNGTAFVVLSGSDEAEKQVRVFANRAIRNLALGFVQPTAGRVDATESFDVASTGGQISAYVGYSVVAFAKFASPFLLPLGVIFGELQFLA